MQFRTSIIPKSAVAILLAAALLASAPGNSYGQPIETARDLRTDCAAFAELAPLKGADPDIYRMPIDTNSAFCYGAFATLEQERPKMKLNVPMSQDCVELKNRIELIQAFIRYVDTHPAVQPRPFREVVLEAEGVEFPCKSQH